MASYGSSSQSKLNTAHPDLITIFNEVVKIFDNTIVYGTRTPAEQFELFKKGRSNIGGIWVVTNKKDVVTYKDGTKEKSNHNYSPSRALDAIPYPIDWKDEKRMYYFAGHVMAIAARLKEEKRITHDMRWGGDFNRNTEIKDETFLDLCHFEIII